MSIKKGFTIIEIIVTIAVLSALALFFAPQFLTSDEQRQESTIRANVSIAASALTSHFALKTGARAEEIADFVANNLNKTTKNPVIRQEKAFSMNSVSQGTVVFVPDNEKKLIEIKGYCKDTANPLLTKTIRSY